MPNGGSTHSAVTSTPVSPAQLQAFTDAAADAVARAIATVQRDAQHAEALRAAEHRAFMAEQREAAAAMLRQIEERMATVRDGADGKDGVDGKDGEPGPPGFDGKDGDQGPAGEPGADGADGRDGQDGANGKDGLGISEALIDSGGELVLTMTDGSVKRLGRVVGRDGADGAPGRDGRNGDPGRDGEAGPEGKQGEPGRDGKDAYAGEARGLFDPEASYRAMDVVSFNGCEWRAKQDDPGPLPGDGWMLSASRGKRGPAGERGPEGRQGPAAASLIAGVVDTQEMELRLTLSDGEELKVDLYDFANLVRTA